MKPIISAVELLRTGNDNDLVLIDASNSADAFQNYRIKHLKGAFFVDLNAELAEIGDAKHGGRHPLPSPEKFLNVLARLGISKASHVVVYDSHSGANAAARFWWTLRAIGHVNVQVLDGGFQAAVAEGFPVSAEIPPDRNTTDYQDLKWQLPIVGIESVRKASEKGKSVIIDVREPRRYRGEYEPIDVVAGHIPGAENIPFLSNLSASGHFRSAGELREMYGKYEGKDVIVHCGSGVTACHTVLAFAVADLEIPKLYVGSWSEWSRNLV